MQIISDEETLAVDPGELMKWNVMVNVG